MSLLRRAYEASVFRPIRMAHLPQSQVLILVFHRSAALTHLTLAIWGLVSVFASIRTLSVLGPWPAIAYGTIVFTAAILAAIGATFFPQTARLEMYALSALIAAVLIYSLFLLWFPIVGDTDRTALFVFSLTPMPLMTGRVFFVYITLIRQRNEQA